MTQPPIPATAPATAPPRLRRRRMSAPAPRAAPPRLPPCRPLPLSLEALDLSPASPAQALASLRFLVLSYLAALERRLSTFESAEWAATALDMLHSIRADVRSHLPDLPSLDLDFDFDFDFDFDLDARIEGVKARLPDLPDVKALVARIDFSRPLSYVPTLSARLRGLHAQLADDELLDTFLADVDAFLAELPSLPSLPSALSASLPSLPASLSRASSCASLPALDKEPTVEEALIKSDYGRRLISYTDLPLEWRNNVWVVSGYRFIPLSHWPRLPLSLVRLHNESLNIHTHLIPLVLWGAAFWGVRVDLSSWLPSSLAGDAAESLFVLFALACLASSALWHTMAGCAHRGGMETCARVDYVGIGWCVYSYVFFLPAMNAVAAPFAWMMDLTSTLAAWPAYHPVGAACLLLCAAAGVSGNVLPFCAWFNRVENRLWRLAFFVGISFSALAPLAGIAALQGWDAMIRFVAPIGPSLLYYIAGLVIYATQIPECFIGARGGWVGRVVDACGGGSHAIWHVFIVLAMRAHRDGLREMRRAAMEGGCAAGVSG
ncbi:hemolysin-III related-domain-containing protein [Mycena vitilis]|nr:hemolysin-III related-domain-containing protein [Mycena vitilis]